jgi:hypothetical protein
MAAWLDAIMAPLNSAGEGIQKLIEVRDLAKFGDALGKLYTQILAAQQGALAALTREQALLEEVGSLKKRVADLEAWDAEKQRYELVALAPNVMACAIKNDMRGNEPAHYICANCYSNGKKSFLNQHVRGTRVDKFRCNSCGEDLTIDKEKGPLRYTTRDPRGGGPDSWMNR